MPEIIRDFAQQRQLVKIFRGQTAQGKNLIVRAAGKHHQQQDRKQKARNGIGHDDQTAGKSIKAAAIAHRFANAQRDRHQIGNQGRPQPQRYGDRHLFQHQIHHADRAEITFAKIEAHIVPHHLQEPLHRRFVKAEFFFQFGYKFRWQAARADIILALGLVDRIIRSAGDGFKHITLAL